MSYFEDMSSHATFLLQPPSRTRGMSNKSSQENCFDCSMKGQLMVNEPIRNNGGGSVSIQYERDRLEILGRGSLPL